MGFPRIFNKNKVYTEATEIPIKKTKILKNDLFDNDNIDCYLEATKVIQIITKHGLSKKSLKLTKNCGLKIKKDLNLTDAEYLLLAVFLIKNKAIISVDGITKFVSGTERLSFNIYKNLFSFYRRGILLVFPSEGDVNFTNSVEFQSYLTEGKWEPSTKQLSLKQIIKNIDSIANLYNNLSPIATLGELEILHILRQNKQYEFCNELLDLYKDSTEETGYHVFVFYLLGHMILSQPRIDKDNDLLDSFCKFDKDREHIVNDIFQHDNHPVFIRKIFDRSIDESGKADQNMIEIHSDFKRKFLQGIIKEKKHESIILSKSIIKKNLYFNEDNQKQITDLNELLQKDSFDKIKERLKTSGARTGFVCLFCGVSGSGKTELVLQIAKNTGRDIVKVDMSSLRSKWWGEDEKNVKSIFSNYKSILQDSKIEPILLLNEADAIIGKRLDITGHNGAIISSINATQNIILEEMENFEGILIATTNLTQNMDEAFKRRFLYKIDFETPSEENRAKIWMEFLKLNDNDALFLAKKFHFTGAQIENIFRKKTANSILYGDSYDLDKIIELCKEEKIEKDARIGFIS
jgi:AAA+ superfamily predicted ATPase